MFIMRSDVPGTYLDYGTKEQRLVTKIDPAGMEVYATFFAAGPMRPRVKAACGFVRATGAPDCIGTLSDLRDIIEGRKGTSISGHH